MLISELIEELIVLKDTYGDLPLIENKNKYNYDTELVKYTYNNKDANAFRFYKTKDDKTNTIRIMVLPYEEGLVNVNQ